MEKEKHKENRIISPHQNFLPDFVVANTERHMYST